MPAEKFIIKDMALEIEIGRHNDRVEALARRGKLLRRGIAEAEAYDEANKASLYPKLRERARLDYAGKILVEQGRPVRPYSHLTDLTPEQKAERKRKQTKLRVKNHRAKKKALAS